MDEASKPLSARSAKRGRGDENGGDAATGGAPGKKACLGDAASSPGERLERGAASAGDAAEAWLATLLNPDRAGDLPSEPDTASAQPSFERMDDELAVPWRFPEPQVQALLGAYLAKASPIARDALERQLAGLAASWPGARLAFARELCARIAHHGLTGMAIDAGATQRLDELARCVIQLHLRPPAEESQVPPPCFVEDVPPLAACLERIHEHRWTDCHEEEPLADFAGPLMRWLVDTGQSPQQNSIRLRAVLQTPGLRWPELMELSLAFCEPFEQASEAAQAVCLDCLADALAHDASFEACMRDDTSGIAHFGPLTVLLRCLGLDREQEDVSALWNRCEDLSVDQLSTVARAFAANAASETDDAIGSRTGNGGSSPRRTRICHPRASC